MPIDCEKSRLYIVIPRATTKKTIQRDRYMQKHYKSTWNHQRCSAHACKHSERQERGDKVQKTNKIEKKIKWKT